MTNVRQRLVQAAARLELLHKRNTGQAAQHRHAAEQMADHATTFAESTENAVVAGDQDAVAQRRRALIGRRRARELAGAGR